ncbi:protein piccolo-like [Toxotes jaculatrix]|uniref:protein piccolo-like n=1 Tax=Toxotes jaculatrix TaxID=941984 RepID=UPI001B3ADABA|nr:protein piccolo-like [Toxotes jaculatrix]
MACSESGVGRILLCLGLFVVVSSFCRCATLTRLKALDKSRENSTLSQGQSKGSGLRHGRLYVGQNPLQGAKHKGTKTTKNLLDIDSDYQADMGWPELKQPKGQHEEFLKPWPDDATVERLLKMEPKVECTGDSMKLQVQDAASTPGSLFFVDRGSRLSPLPLSKLPPSCGYTIRSTRRDLVLVAPYDGCFVALEEDSYVLPLRWWGVPVRMSCPVMRPSSPNPPMVTCHAKGMVVKTEWTVSVSKIKVNLNGNWEPLMKAAPRCGFSVIEHPEGVVISVHYAPCLEAKDGMYTLELAGEGETKISCPSLSEAQSETTKVPAKGPKQPAETPSRQSAVPQAPGFPQYPEVLSKKPDERPKDIIQPQLPYYPFYPHYFYPYQVTKAPPTVQTLPFPVTKKNELQSQQTVYPSNLPVAPEGQVPQPLIPFYQWPVQPEKVPVEKEPPVQPPATQPPNRKVNGPFYTYPYYLKPLSPDVPPALRPELKPKPTSPPFIQATQGQRQLPYYPFPYYPKLPKPETPSTQAPVTKPPPHKWDQHVLPYPFIPSSGPPQKPLGPPASQPGGQEQKPFIPFYIYPQPPASGYSQVEQPSPEKPLPEKTVPPEPTVPQKPQGQIYPPFYQYPFYPPFLPQGPYQTQLPPTQQTPTPAPKGQIQQLPSPLQPEISKPQVPGHLSPSKPAPESKGPPQPEDPRGQVHQYPYPLYPQPDPGKHLASVQQPEAPWGQVHPMPYPYYFYLQPEPEKQPAEKPVHKPSHPQQPSKIPGAGTNGAKTPTGKPVPSEQPPGVTPPDGQIYNGFNLFYPQQPQHPQPITLPPTTSMLQPQQVAITQPATGGIVPQGPQPAPPYMPPLYCPQFCPSGFSNCCPQIAFHQHHHHIVPAGRGSKDTPVYPQLSFLPSLAQFGFGYGLGTAPLPQEPTEATAQAFTYAPISLQPLPPANEKQPYLLPPDGNPAEQTRSTIRKPTSPEPPVYPYFIPNSLYPKWPFLPQNEKVQNLPQSQSAAHYNVPSNPQAPVVQYEPYYIQSPEQQMSKLSPGDMNNPSGPKFMSYLSQYQQQEHVPNQQREWRAKNLQPSNTKPHKESERLTHSKVQSELKHVMVPYYMLQDDQAPADNSSQPQVFLSGSEKSTQHEQTDHPSSEPKSFVLLKHGLPGRELNSFDDSPLPFRDLVRDTNFLSQNVAKPHSRKPSHSQNLKPLHPKWQGEMSGPLPGNIDYMPRPGDKSESLTLHAFASDHPHFVPLPQDPSVSAVHLRPEFPESLKDMWKPITPLGTHRRIPAHVPGKAFQRSSSAADHQDGINPSMERVEI